MIDFVNNSEPDLTAENLIKLQQDIGTVVSPTEPQGNERLKVWIQKGKNLLSEYNWEQGAINQTTGKVSASNSRLRTFNFIYVKPNIPYLISVEDKNYCFINIIMYDENDNYINAYYNIDSSINGATSKIVEFSNNCTKIKIVLRHTDNVSVLTPSLISTIKPMLVQSPTIIEYEPYIKPKLYILNSNNEYETLLESKEIEFTDYKTGIVKKDTYVSKVVTNWCEVKDRIAYVNIKIELTQNTIDTAGYAFLEGLPPSKVNAEVQAHLYTGDQNESIRLRIYDTGELYWWYNPSKEIKTGDVIILDISYPTL